MLYKETDDTLISSQSSPTNTTSQSPSIPDKKLKMKCQANSEFTEIAKKMMPKEMQITRQKIYRLICLENTLVLPSVEK